MFASNRNDASPFQKYSRMFPTAFDTAKGSEVWDNDGRRFIDFYAGAGTLNYGRNNELGEAALPRTLELDMVQDSFDFASKAKLDFLHSFRKIILQPRGLDHQIRIAGQSSTDAIEAALTLARKTTGRSDIVAFTRAHHGCPTGAPALAANRCADGEPFAPRSRANYLPYDGYAAGLDSAAFLQQLLCDPSGGLPIPAAVILETIQAEGGVNVASDLWLNQIAEMCSEQRIVLIVDDTLVGNGRTGDFFSFEKSGIIPDMVCLSDATGGGLPMSLLLLRPEHAELQSYDGDTELRGHNLAFAQAIATLEYWKTAEFSKHIDLLRQHTLARLAQLVEALPEHRLRLRGRGLIQAIDVGDGKKVQSIVEACFKAGLLVAPASANAEVLKIMPALTTPLDVLIEGLDILDTCVRAVLNAADVEQTFSAPEAVTLPIRT